MCQLGDKVWDKEGKLDSTGLAFQLLMWNISKICNGNILLIFLWMLQLVRMERIGVWARGS